MTGTHLNKSARGFTLIEIAVAVVVIALLLGSILVPLATQVEQRQISDTQKILDNIKEALVGFALTNGYLPCPDKTSGSSTPPNDVPNDGNEDFSAAGTCIAAEGGNVPWATLGVGNTDAWGNRFRYRVDTDFARRSPATTFTLTTGAGLRVCTTAACTVSLTSSTSGNGAAAVILSHGKNGLGAINSLTNSTNPAPTSADELENTDGNATFVSRVATPTGAAAGEFDDIVSWLSKYTLFNRMVAAGKLP